MNINVKLPQAVTQKAGRAALIASKNSPQILFGAGVIGVVGTVVLACRATLKVDEVLQDVQKEMANVDIVVSRNSDGYDIHDAKRDIATVKTRAAFKIAKLYAPSVILGGLSIAALTGSHNIQQNRIAGLTAAYAALEKGFNEYRKRVVDEYGEDVDRDMRYGKTVSKEIEKTASGGTKTTEVVKHNGKDASRIYGRIFDQFNRNWEPNDMSNKHFLQLQQTYANDRLNAYGHLFLNEVYDMLGFPRTPEGAVVGWVWRKHPEAKDGFVDFGIFEKGNSDIRDSFNGKDGWLLDFNVDGLIFELLDEEA